MGTAIILWRVVFSLREPALLSRWLAFLSQEPPATHGITRDTWDVFLNFLDTVGHDLTLYNDLEAWPTLIDDFVEHEMRCLTE
jgi:DCN1-like protein 3